jgi:hypothetical protein
MTHKLYSTLTSSQTSDSRKIACTNTSKKYFCLVDQSCSITLSIGKLQGNEYRRDYYMNDDPVDSEQWEDWDSGWSKAEYEDLTQDQ